MGACCSCCASPCAASSYRQPACRNQEGTNLVDLHISHIREAHKYVGLDPEFRGKRPGAHCTPVTLIPDRSMAEIGCCRCCWVSIPEGFTAIVTRFGGNVQGTEPDGSWASGFHWFYPWNRVSRLVSKQLIIFDSPIQECKTKDDIPVTIEVLIVFGIDDAQKFVYDVGAEKLDALFRATQEEMLRMLVSETEIAHIYDLHGTSTDTFVSDINEQLKPYGVRVRHFTVRNVIMPPDWATDFQDKTLYESKTAEKIMEQQMNVLNLSNTEERQKLQEQCDNAEMAFKQQAVTTKSQICKETSEVLACTRKEVLLLETRRDADIKDKRAAGDLENARLQSQISRLTSETKARLQQESEMIDNKVEEYEKTKSSAGKKEASKKVNDGKRVLAEVEGRAASVFAARRAQELEMLRIDILDAIASNDTIEIVTTRENESGIAPDNSLVAQCAQQGMEAFRMVLAGATLEAAKQLKLGSSMSAGVVRPAQEAMR